MRTRLVEKRFKEKTGAVVEHNEPQEFLQSIERRNITLSSEKFITQTKEIILVDEDVKTEQGNRPSQIVEAKSNRPVQVGKEWKREGEDQKSTDCPPTMTDEVLKAVIKGWILGVRAGALALVVIEGSAAAARKDESLVLEILFLAIGGAVFGGIAGAIFCIVVVLLGAGLGATQGARAVTKRLEALGAGSIEDATAESMMTVAGGIVAFALGGNNWVLLGIIIGALTAPMIGVSLGELMATIVLVSAGAQAGAYAAMQAELATRQEAAGLLLASFFSKPGAIVEALLMGIVTGEVTYESVQGMKLNTNAALIEARSSGSDTGQITAVVLIAVINIVIYLYRHMTESKGGPSSVKENC